MAREREERAQANLEPRRRLLAAGPPLRDVESALECLDSCHPRVDVTDRCEGGTSCRCQDTEEQAAARKEKQNEAWRSLRDMWDTPEEHAREAKEQAAVAEAVERLGVDVSVCGGAAPFNIAGVVDGLAFYVKERHQHFRVQVAPPERPLFEIYKEAGGQGELEIMAGPDVDLYEGDSGVEAVNALTNAVMWVRDYQRRSGCSHILTNEKGSIQFRFCPICGIRAEDVTGFKQ